ncbi:hypothetical protein [Streptosporangium sp. KLBMP 9127]|nr:hypothetical protein [Streptosporangium sp. KLBMP 9127]
MPYIGSVRDLTYSVLDALGKVLPERVDGRLPRLTWECTVSWTLGYRLHAVVVNRAHTMPSSLYDALRELVAQTHPSRARPAQRSPLLQVAGEGLPRPPATAVGESRPWCAAARARVKSRSGGWCSSPPGTPC